MTIVNRLMDWLMGAMMRKEEVVAVAEIPTVLEGDFCCIPRELDMASLNATLAHYSENPRLVLERREWVDLEKPAGLWLSLEGDDYWGWFEQLSDLPIEGRSTEWRYSAELASDARIILLDREDYHTSMWKFLHEVPRTTKGYIKWEALARLGWDGVAFIDARETANQLERHPKDRDLFGGVDVDSLCVWNVHKVRLSEPVASHAPPAPPTNG